MSKAILAKPAFALAMIALGGLPASAGGIFYDEPVYEAPLHVYDQDATAPRWTAAGWSYPAVSVVYPQPAAVPVAYTVPYPVEVAPAFRRAAADMPRSTRPKPRKRRCR